MKRNDIVRYLRRHGCELLREGDQPSLDYGGKRNPDGQGFAAFGKVVDGMDVVRSIQAQTDEGQYLKEQVKIREISL